MPYIYFCCRKHAPPVKESGKVERVVPGAYACPRCPTCGKAMEYYATGAAATDPFPVPPRCPGPPPPHLQAAPPKLPDEEIEVYCGVGKDKLRSLVTWTITRNPLKCEMTIKLELGVPVAGQYRGVQIFKLADGLLDTNQAAGKQVDWWVNAPYRTGADKAVWHSFNLRALIDPPPNPLPDTIDIGVKLGCESFGLIHLLAGHAKSVRHVGEYSVEAPNGDKRVEAYTTLLSLQTGMQRFTNAAIRQIYHDVANDKLVIMGGDSGKIVLTRSSGSPRYGVTTLYNDPRPPDGIRIYG